MNIRRLRYFLRAAAEGSLSKAAQAYGIAQPALTRQMQLLEEEIGVKVFERTSRGMKLTETGLYLKDAIETPLGEIETALKSAATYTKQIKATVTMGFPPQLPALIGQRIVSRLQAELPNIALRIFEENSGNLASGLSRRVLDVAFLVTTIPEQRVSWTRILSEPLFLVGAPSPASPKGKSIRFNQLKDLPLVLPSAPAGLRILLEQAAAIAGTKITPVMEVHSPELTKQLVGVGDLYTLLPQRGFQSELKDGSLRCWSIVDPAVAQSVMWAVKPDLQLPRAVFDELERIVIEEAYDAVSGGEWPANWEYDFSRLSTSFQS